MSIAHPARHYIYYLLSRRVHDAKGVLQQLSDLNLPVPDRDYDDYSFNALVRSILRTRAGMTFPVGFNPRAINLSEATTAWLKEWKVKDFWAGVPAVHAAIDILSEPQVRHLLELLLLGPMTASAISSRIATRFGLSSDAMNPRVVKTYSHYFWDPNALSPMEWKRFLAMQPYRDTRDDFHAALQAPRSAAGAAFLLALADKDPQQLSPAERYETASTMAFGMLMHHALSETSSTGHTYAAFTALNMMRMADEEVSRHKGASTDLIDELRRLSTVYDKAQPLQITNAAFIQRPALEDNADQEVIDVPADE